MNCDYCGQPLEEIIALLVYPNGKNWSDARFDVCNVEELPQGVPVAHATQPANRAGCSYKLWEKLAAAD